MSDRAEQLERIRDAARAMSEQDFAALKARVLDDVDVIFELAEQGDVVCLVALAQDDPSLLIRGDRLSQNLLHHASREPSGIMAELLTETPSMAVWHRDVFGASPLDLAQDAGHKDVIDILTPITYPQLFLDEVAPYAEFSVEREQALRRKLVLYAALERRVQTRTLPGWSMGFEPTSMAEPLNQPDQRHDRDRDDERDR